MQARELMKLLMSTSLLAGCCKDDGTEEFRAFASYAMFGAQIAPCASGDAGKCRELCSAAYDPHVGPAWQIEDCAIDDSNADGVNLSGHIRIYWSDECLGGRRPRGFVAPARRSGIGAWLSRLATLEAASVTAFARLGEALVRLGAPRAMIARSRDAMNEEVFHARLVGALARHFGGCPEAPVITETPPPTALELAIENAVEGQVGETFGALVATCQARSASDPHVRAAFARIARDEAGHAALAHQLARWLDRELAPHERSQVADARRAAVLDITGDVGLDRVDRAILGIPSSERLHAAAAATFAALLA